MYSSSYVRVLVVDDFKSFRQFLITTLRQLPEVQEIFEAEDGLEAVAKTEEVRPDLVLLDIGLPNLNGIEAAKLIRRFSPESKILFVSQESSPDVVRLALQVGGQGYVVKRDAGNDLVTAIRILLSGQKFVGARFAGNDFFENSDERQEIRRHEILVYSDEAAFFEGFTQFAGRRLMDGNAVVVVATEQHRNGLLSRLQLFGVDIAFAMEQRRYISLDAAETLKAILVNGMPDRERFSKIAGELMLGVAKAAHLETDRIAACGECAPMLWGEAAIQFERMWNAAIRQYNVEVFCGYSLHRLEGGVGSEIFQRICAEHSAIISA